MNHHAAVENREIFKLRHGRLFLAGIKGLFHSVLVHQLGRLVTFSNSERFLHNCSCPTVRDWIAVFPALFPTNATDVTGCSEQMNFWGFLLSSSKQCKIFSLLMLRSLIAFPSPCSNCRALEGSLRQFLQLYPSVFHSTFFSTSSSFFFLIFPPFKRLNESKVDQFSFM